MTRKKKKGRERESMIPPGPIKEQRSGDNVPQAESWTPAILPYTH
jgi:hypothetical protein